MQESTKPEIKMTSENTSHKFSCSFCGKNQNEVKNIIAGPNVFICDECVELCEKVIAEGKGIPKFLKHISGPLNKLRRELSFDRRLILFWGTLILIIILQVVILYGVFFAA